MFLRRRLWVYVIVAANISVLVLLYTKMQQAVSKLIAEPDAVGKPVLKDEVRAIISKDTVPDISLKYEVSSTFSEDEDDFLSVASEKKVPISTPRNLSQSCSAPKTNIMFVKPHKTGTSTIQNLLFRFALKNQLIVAMPLPFHVQVLSEFHRNILFALKPGNQYNIFAHHAIFNYEEARAVMPADTIYVTILRHPVAQFESAYSFLGLSRLYGMNLTAYALLNRSEPEQRELQNKRKFNFGRNQQAFDLGMDLELFDDEAAVLKKIRRLDEQLDLVMITERMDESLILLKEKLCWNGFDDIVSVKRNVREKEKKVELSLEMRKNLQAINGADAMIYDYFNQKFNEELERFGSERMKMELKQLEMAREEVTRKCKYEPKEKEMCANLLKFGGKFSAEIFALQLPFYDVTESQLKPDALVPDLVNFMRPVPLLES